MLFLRVIAWYGAEKFSLKKVVSIFTSGGDMSIIGTRPPLISETNFYELHHRARLAIKPGITGMWQVSGRSDITDFEEVVRLDKEYTKRKKKVAEGTILQETVNQEEKTLSDKEKAAIADEEKAIKKRNRIPFYPSDWKDSFGLPVEEHKKALEINMCEEYCDRIQSIEWKWLETCYPYPERDGIYEYYGGERAGAA